MKATILKVKWMKEVDTKWGKKQSHAITFPNENLEEVTGFYLSNSKEQKNFIPGQEAEFTIEEHTTKEGKSYFNVKPIRAQKYSNFGRQLQKEQSRYSGFAMSYAKDLVVGGRIQKGEMYSEADKMFKFMVELDKSINHD